MFVYGCDNRFHDLGTPNVIRRGHVFDLSDGRLLLLWWCVFFFAGVGDDGVLQHCSSHVAIGGVGTAVCL